MTEFTPFAPVTIQMEIALAYGTALFLVVAIAIKIVGTFLDVMKGEYDD